MTDMSVQDASPLSRFLRMAVMAGVENAIQIHIDRGDNLNARDDKGQTPLMLSAARNKAAICKLLLAAGADAALLDPSGRNALGIAQAAGACEAASAIEAACTLLVAPCDSDVFCEPAHVVLDEQWVQAATDPPTILLVDSAAQPTEQPPSVSGLGTATMTTSEWVSDEDGDSFDLNGWEAEEDQPPPEGDPTLSAAASGIQSAISGHQPIDTSADWDDFEAFLPDRATPLPRADDAESRERLRLVLLRAIREGNAHGLWHDFYNSPYNLLAIEALAKWVHPQLFAKLDPQATMEQINQQFLGMPLQGAYWVDARAPLETR